MQMLIYSMPSDYTYLNSVYRQVTNHQNKQEQPTPIERELRLAGLLLTVRGSPGYGS